VRQRSLRFEAAGRLQTRGADREQEVSVLDDAPLSLGQGIALVFLFAFSAFFSGSETAFFSIPRFRVRKFKEKGEPATRQVALLLDRPNRLLVTLLTGNTIVNVPASAILGLALERALYQAGLPEPAAFVLAVIAMTGVLLLLGEISPKIFALRDPERTASLVARPVAFVELMLAPIGKLLLGVSGFLLKVFGAQKLRAAPFITEAELETMVSLSEREGVLHREERRMIEGIMEFTDTTVKEVLVPRTDVRVLRKSATVSAALELIRATGYSRIPVFSETIDDIVGVLYAKDLLPFVGERDTDTPIGNLLRPAYFVPENKMVAELLSEFRQNRVHCAIAVDEHGGTAGFVTLEDLLEEVVGEIQDERDVEKPLIEEAGPEGVVVDARAPLDELSEVTGYEFRDDDHESVGGLILSLTGHLPKKGEKIKHSGLTFVVEEVSERRILKIRVIPTDKTSDSGNDTKR
jgi:putative hemolysin